jgi:hypothetical protein
MEIILNETVEYDLPFAIRQYFLERIVRIRTPLDSKVLLLDKNSARVLNSFCTMSDLTASGILLVENVCIRRKPLPKVDAIYFVTPTQEVVDAMIKDFEDPEKPMYNTAHIFFTSALGEKLMQRIAQERIVSRIKTFKEANLDFLVQEAQVFRFDSDDSFYKLYSPLSTLAQKEQIKIAHKLVTLCATLGEFPYIRYTKGSGHAVGVATHVLEELHKLRKAKVLRPKEPRAVLLIVDRVDDLVSVLVHEFTYQAMIYDLLHENIRDNYYKYSYKNEADEEVTVEMPLDETDKIWTYIRHQHIEPCKKWIATTVNEFKKKRDEYKAQKESKDSNALREIVRTLPKYEILRKKIGFHVNVTHELMQRFNSRNLDEIADIEQDLATGRNRQGKEPKEVTKRVKALLASDKFREEDKIRVLLLWAVTTDKASECYDEVIQMGHFTHPDKVTQMLKSLLALKSISSKKDQRRAARDGEWVYYLSRYVPPLKDILESVVKNTLSTKECPYLNKENDSEEKQTSQENTPKTEKSKRKVKEQQSKWQQNNTNTSSSSSSAVTIVQKRDGPRIIVFIVGGMTFSETRVVYEVSKAKNRDIIIGSTHFLTPHMFVNELKRLLKGSDDPEPSESSAESSHSESHSSEIFKNYKSNTNTNANTNTKTKTKDKKLKKAEFTKPRVPSKQNKNVNEEMMDTAETELPQVSPKTNTKEEESPRVSAVKDKKQRDK